MRGVGKEEGLIIHRELGNLRESKWGFLGIQGRDASDLRLNSSTFPLIMTSKAHPRAPVESMQRVSTVRQIRISNGGMGFREICCHI